MRCTAVVTASWLYLAAWAVAQGEVPPPAPSWTTHPGWGKLIAGEAREAADAFAADLATTPRTADRLEYADAMALGLSIAAATVAFDILRTARDYPADPVAADRANKLLDVMFQNTVAPDRFRSSAQAPPWKEALARLLLMYPPPATDFRLLPPGIAVGPDGTRYCLEMPDGRYLPDGHQDDYALLTIPPGSVGASAAPVRAFWYSLGESRGPPTDLALSPDGVHLYVVSDYEIAAVSTASLRRGSPAFTWRFARPLMGGPCAAVPSRDGRLVLWWAAGGLGSLDAATGAPRAQLTLRPGCQWRPRPSHLCRAGLAQDRSRIYMPIARPAEGKGPLLASYPGNVVFGERSVSYRFERDTETQTASLDSGPAHDLDARRFGHAFALWMALDPDTGTIAGPRGNPWLPAASAENSPPSSTTSFRHAPPDWCPSVPEGTVHCITQTGTVILADPARLELIGQSAIPVGHYGQIATPADLSFAPPLRVLCPDQEWGVVAALYSKCIATPTGVGEAAELAGREPAARLPVALALLTAATTGLAHGVDARWPALQGRSGLSVTAIEPPPRQHLRGTPVEAWRALWLAYLRYVTATDARQFLSLPPGWRRLGAADEASGEQPLADETRWEPRKLLVPASFTPVGAAVSTDGRWFYRPLGCGLLYDHIAAGQACFWVGPVGSVADVVRDRDSDAVMVATGSRQLEIDARHGRIAAVHCWPPRWWRTMELGAWRAQAGCLGRWIGAGDGGLVVVDRQTGRAEEVTFPRPPAVFEGPFADHDRAAAARDPSLLPSYGCRGVDFGYLGAELLVPVVRNKPDVAGWLRYDPAAGRFGEFLTVRQVVAPEQFAAWREANPRVREPDFRLPASVFPGTEHKWVFTKSLALALGGSDSRSRVIAYRPGSARNPADTMGSSGGTSRTITIIRR